MAVTDSGVSLGVSQLPLGVIALMAHLDGKSLFRLEQEHSRSMTLAWRILIFLS